MARTHLRLIVGVLSFVATGPAAQEPEPVAPVVDLMDALRKSVAEVKESKPKTKAASKGGSRKRVAARKSA